MATQKGSGQINTNRTFTYSWSGLLNGDVGNAIKTPNYADKTVQIVGTMGVGGSVAMEGSNDGGTTWQALKDFTGSTIALTASGQMALLAEVPQLLRPHVTAGDGTTTIAAYLIASGGA